MTNIFKNIQRSFEKNYVKLMGWEHIPNTQNNLVYVDIKKHKGKKILLKNDVIINPGDTIAEMHIDNLNIHKIDNSLKSILKNFKVEMSCLVDACKHNDKFADIKAVYGITVLHPLLRYLGFERFPLKNPLFRIYLKWWENMLKASFSNAGNQKSRKKDEPMICWVSIETLDKKTRTNKERQ